MTVDGSAMREVVGAGDHVLVLGRVQGHEATRGLLAGAALQEAGPLAARMPSI